MVFIMKRIAAVIIFLFLISALAVTVAAESSVKISLSAKSSTARPGDIVSVTVSMSGVGAAGGIASGQVKITYDNEKLIYQSATIGSGKPAADLDSASSGNTVTLLYFDNKGGSGGFSSDGALAILNFKVKEVPPGSASFSADAEGFGNKNAGAVTASASGTSLTIAAPFSNNNNLESLTVSNASISPAFSASTTKYTANVPFGISKLDIAAKAQDPAAKVSVGSPNLAPGGKTNVTVTVTAESGSKKIYTITVTRAKDPNYVPDSNNQLKGISLDVGILSPLFKEDITDYVVWLPYESERIRISGTAKSSLASVRTQGGEALKAGEDNAVKVICKAENGSERLYTVIIKRAPAHGEEYSSNKEIEDTVGNNSENSDAEADPESSFPIIFFIITAAAALIVGGGIGFCLNGSLQKRNADKSQE